MRRKSRVTSRMSVAMNSRNPGAEMLNRYGPSLNWATVYTPSSLVVVFVATEVSTLVAVTAAPRITAPLLSVTVPVMVAKVVWAVMAVELSVSRTSDSAARPGLNRCMAVSNTGVRQGEPTVPAQWCIAVPRRNCWARGGREPVELSVNRRMKPAQLGRSA